MSRKIQSWQSRSYLHETLCPRMSTLKTVTALPYELMAKGTEMRNIEEAGWYSSRYFHGAFHCMVRASPRPVYHSTS